MPTSRYLAAPKKIKMGFFFVVMVSCQLQCKTIQREMLAMSFRGEMMAAVAQLTVRNETALVLQVVHHA